MIWMDVLHPGLPPLPKLPHQLWVGVREENYEFRPRTELEEVLEPHLDVSHGGQGSEPRIGFDIHLLGRRLQPNSDCDPRQTLARPTRCVAWQVFASFTAQSDMQLIDIGSAKLGSSASEMYDLWKPAERMHERLDRALFLYRQRPAAKCTMC